MVKKIKVEQVLKKKTIFIDTRSPAEFALDHLPNAVNLPILDNEERAIVGTLYKQVSRDEAIKKGMEFFSPRLPLFIEKAIKYKDQQLVVYCWRGGMRSRAVVALLESLGYDVLQLEGGYKAYRSYIRERLENYNLKPKIIVLWGLTCTGKTKLLKYFNNSLDLEGLAQHRGSLYGAIGLRPNSQKKFDNLFLQELDKLNGQEYIIVEGESRKIGDVQIPAFFYKAMLKGKHVLIKRDINLRAQLAVDEYFKPECITDFRKITLTLFRVIGKKKKQMIIDLIDKGDLKGAAKILLEEYYDPLYAHTLKKFNYALEVCSDDEEQAVKEIKNTLLPN